MMSAGKIFVSKFFVFNNERWERLAEQQGVAYAKTVAEAMNLKLDMDNPADREKLRRAVLDLVAGRKMRKQKRPGFRQQQVYIYTRTGQTQRTKTSDS